MVCFVHLYEAEQQLSDSNLIQTIELLKQCLQKICSDSVNPLEILTAPPFSPLSSPSYPSCSPKMFFTKTTPVLQRPVTVRCTPISYGGRQGATNLNLYLRINMSSVIVKDSLNSQKKRKRFVEYFRIVLGACSPDSLVYINLSTYLLAWGMPPLGLERPKEHPTWRPSRVSDYP